MRARPGGCAFSTNSIFTFLGSPSPLLLFHMHLASVQPLYQATGSSEFARISFDRTIRHCRRRSNVWARPGGCAFSTNSIITFLGSPSP